MKKHKIIVAARTSWHLRDLVESGTLEQLKKNFDLTFLYFNSKISTSNQDEEYDLSEYGKIYSYPKKIPNWLLKKEKGIRRKIQTLRKVFRPSINHTTFFLNEIGGKKKYIQKKNLYNQLYLSLFKFEILFIKICNFFKIDFFMTFFLKFFLNLTCPKIIPRNEKYDLALVCYNSYNVFAYIDDFLRDSKKIGLKTFGLQMDLDNLIDRKPLVDPDYLGVWGMQTFTWCINEHKILPYRLALIGTPRVDLLKKTLPNKDESKSFLKIPKDSNVLLFCPASRNHDENYILHKFQEGVDKNFFPKNTFIFFKDHAGKIFTQNNKNDPYKIKDKPKLKNVIFWSEIDNNFYRNSATPLDTYRYFYGASDATISPLSTMHVEAMLLGIPALCYTYSIDPKLYPHDLQMSQYKHRIYHYPSLRSDGVIICEKRENINENIKEILLKSKETKISEICKMTASQGIYTGVDFASERIVKNIYKILNDNSFDNSSNFYK